MEPVLSALAGTLVAAAVLLIRHRAVTQRLAPQPVYIRSRLTR